MKIINRNVVVLTLAQILALSISPALMFIGSIIGQQLAPSKEWATLPITSMIVGTSVGVYPIISLMQRVGRKPVFIASILTIALASFVIVIALQRQSFALYCLCIVVIGGGLAAIQQFRFAAMESVTPKKMPLAASSVMLAGVAAAFIGPELIMLGQHWFVLDFSGSFVLIALVYLVCAVIMLFYRPPKNISVNCVSSGITIRQLFSKPLFWIAILNGAIGFALMSFIMVATPISMHDHHGHSLADTKWVIQSHVSAMYLPSLILPWLIQRFGVQPVMVLGFICYIFTIVLGLANPGLWYYWFALVFLGIGWNFLFVSATTLLPHTQEAQYHLKAQAVNDTIVFSAQAVAVLCSGVVLNLWGWHMALFSCLPVIALQLCIHFYCNQKCQQQSDKNLLCDQAESM